MKPVKTKTTIYFTMVLHPINGWIRSGKPYSEKQYAKDWLPFVSGAWRGCRAKVVPFTLKYVDGVLTKETVVTLDKKFNLDA
jgi:hypothetical protein